MTAKSTITKEFNNLYQGMIELCRRVYAEEPYPRKQCVTWFVEYLGKILGSEEYKQRLNAEGIKYILEMSSNIKKSELSNKEQKNKLEECSEELLIMLNELEQTKSK